MKKIIIGIIGIFALFALLLSLLVIAQGNLLDPNQDSTGTLDSNLDSDGSTDTILDPTAGTLDPNQDATGTIDPNLNLDGSADNTLDPVLNLDGSADNTLDLTNDTIIDGSLDLGEINILPLEPAPDDGTIIKLEPDPEPEPEPIIKEELKLEPEPEEIPTILPIIPPTEPVFEPIRPPEPVLQIIKEPLPPLLDEKISEEIRIIEVKTELVKSQNAIREISKGLVEKQSSPQATLSEKTFKQSQVKKDLEKQINHAKDKIQIKKEVRQEVIAEEEITIISTIISPKEETQYNVIIYEIIPKEIAKSAADLIFYGDISVDIIQDDPIIAWHLPVVDKEIKLHYAVKKKADLVLEKIQTLPASEEQIIKKETIFQKFKLFFSILLTVFIILMVILIKKIERQLW